ncbi:MAG: YgaP-like transmembrane domain [Patescibacteria group bacterium]
MKFAKFMSTPTGRWLRIIVGLILILLGMLAVHGKKGIVVAIIGLILLLAGIFNFCVLAPLFGGHFKGSDNKS